MLLSKDQKTEELIIYYLGQGPTIARDLIGKIMKDEGITFQGVYKALANLKKEEVIVKHKQTISLSIPWVHRLTRFTDEAIRAYSIKSYNLFLNFKERQRTTLSFNDFTDIYTYWVHMMISLAQEYDQPIFLYNSHDWYVLARPDLKSEFFIWIDKFKRSSFMLIGHNKQLDQETAKNHRSDFLQIASVDKKLFNDWSYIVAIGDFIIETRCEKQTANEVNMLYEKYTSYNEDMKQDIDKIVSRKQIWKLIVTRNENKAHATRKRLSKYFYVPKEARDKI